MKDNPWLFTLKQLVDNWGEAPEPGYFCGQKNSSKDNLNSARSDMIVPELLENETTIFEMIT